MTITRDDVLAILNTVPEPHLAADRIVALFDAEIKAFAEREAAAWAKLLDLLRPAHAP